MQINVVSCLFVLDSEKNTNIRKNDIKKIKVLLSKDKKLPMFVLKKGDLKRNVKDSLSKIIGSSIFHLEQVYTMDYDDSIDIVYIGVTNIENVIDLNEEYQLVEFKIEDNNNIVIDDKIYKYQTLEIEENKNMEYIHKIDVEDEKTSRMLMSLLISYKRIRSNIDNTDIIFKFMGSFFTLEDVRIVYELIKRCSVDKSNFRKKIMKYCEKLDEPIETKQGFRPSQKYRFKPLKGDVWL